MKHVDKKLVGITAIGLSAWILVIGLVIINKNTTTAMFTSTPVSIQQSAPQTLGATTLASGEINTTAPTEASANTRSTLPVVLVAGSILVAASAILASIAIRKRSTKT